MGSEMCIRDSPPPPPLSPPLSPPPSSRPPLLSRSLVLSALPAQRSVIPSSLLCSLLPSIFFPSLFSLRPYLKFPRFFISLSALSACGAVSAFASVLLVGVKYSNFFSNYYCTLSAWLFLSLSLSLAAFPLPLSSMSSFTRITLHPSSQKRSGRNPSIIITSSLSSAQKWWKYSRSIF